VGDQIDFIGIARRIHLAPGQPLIGRMHTDGERAAVPLHVDFREHLGGILVLRRQVGFALALELRRPILAEIPGRNGVSGPVGPAAVLPLGGGILVGMDAEDAAAQAGGVGRAPSLVEAAVGGAPLGVLGGIVDVVAALAEGHPEIAVGVEGHRSPGMPVLALAGQEVDENLLRGHIQGILRGHGKTGQAQTGIGLGIRGTGPYQR
jgi:hypothetical protein